MYNKIVDSGKKETFKTGYQRDSRIGKGRYDLLPMSALDRLARHYENGATKYGDRNWELGAPLSRHVDSALRHVSKWMRGFNDEDHLAAAAWNIFAILYTEEKILDGSLDGALLKGLPSELLKRYKQSLPKTNKKV